MMDQLNVAIVGCGSIAQTAHIPLLKRMQGICLSSLVDTEAANIRKAHKLAPAAALHSTIEAMLRDDEVDAVVIASPTAQHAWHARASFDAGKHVYLEEPIAMSTAEAEPVIDSWTRSGAIGAIGHNYRFNPVYMNLRDLIRTRSGDSAIRFITVFCVPRPHPSSWLKEKSGGGGVLLDLATHHLDLLRFLSGSEIATVAAQLKSHVTDEDHAELDIVLESGSSAHVTCAYADSFIDQVTVETNSGRLEADRSRKSLLPFKDRIRHFARKLQSPMHEPSYETALMNFVDSIRLNRPCKPDLEDGMAVLNVIKAARQSAASGLPTPVGKRSVPVSEYIDMSSLTVSHPHNRA
jgi:predicted dehydrogenase